jgi:hypothetical protein
MAAGQRPTAMYQNFHLQKTIMENNLETQAYSKTIGHIIEVADFTGSSRS